MALTLPPALTAPALALEVRNDRRLRQDISRMLKVNADGQRQVTLASRCRLGIVTAAAVTAGQVGISVLGADGVTPRRTVLSRGGGSGVVQVIGQFERGQKVKPYAAGGAPGNATPTIVLLTERNTIAKRFDPPGLPDISAEYWRIRNAGSEDIWLDMAEIEFTATVGGTRINGGTQLAMIGSGFTNYQSAFDQNGATYAERRVFTGLQNMWIGMRYVGNPQIVKGVRIQVANTFPSRSPSAIFVDSSTDGTNWTPRFYGINATPYTANGWKNFTLRELPTTRATALIWGMNCTAINGGWLTIMELMFRATTGGASLCTGGIGMCDKSSGGAQVHGSAFDGNNTTFWQAGAGVTSGKIWYCFDTPPNPNFAAIQAWSGNANTDAPRDFSFFYSLDGITETAVFTKTAETWTNSQVREYALP